MKKRMELERLAGWAEDAICHAEIENCMPAEECTAAVDRMVARGRKLVAEARAAGIAEDEIRGAVWYPYEDALCGKE